VGNNPWSYTDPFGEGPLTWALGGDYDASDWTTAGVISQASGLGLKGLFWTGPKNTVTGIAGAVAHPIRTAQGIGNFAAAAWNDPGAVGSGIWDDIKSIPHDSERIGSIVFDVASSIATGGTVKAASTAGKAAKILGDIPDVASAAKTTRVIPAGQHPAMASTFGDAPKGITQGIGRPEDVYPKGSFSIIDWRGYPSNLPRPAGPFRLVENPEYDAARKAANKVNADLHKANPALQGKVVHEIHPVKFGGSPTELANKTILTQKDHAPATVWWNKMQRQIESWKTR